MNINRGRFLCLLLGLLILSSCFDGRKALEPIPVGLIASLTGDIPRPGKQTLDGANLAIQEINAAGGIDVGGTRKPLTLIVEDDQRLPEVSVSKAMKLINRDRVVAILGLPFSLTAIPVSEAAEKNRIPMISTQSTNPLTTLDKQYVFRMAFLDSFQGTVMAEFAWNDLGAKKAAALFDAASSYSVDLCKCFKAAFEKKGGKVVAFEGYTADEKDIGDRLRKIKQGGAQVFFIPAYSPHMRTLIIEAWEAGIRATLLGGDSWHTFLPEEYPIEQEAYYSDIWSSDSPDPLSREFVKKYEETYKERPMNSAALAYDAVYLLAQAIRTRGAADSESIRKGLSSISEFSGVCGSMRFEGSGDPRRSAVILKIKKGEPSSIYRQVQP